MTAVATPCLNFVRNSDLIFDQVTCLYIIKHTRGYCLLCAFLFCLFVALNFKSARVSVLLAFLWF